MFSLLYQDAFQELRYILSYDTYIQNVPWLNIITWGDYLPGHSEWKILQQSWYWSHSKKARYFNNKWHILFVPKFTSSNYVNKTNKMHSFYIHLFYNLYIYSTCFERLYLSSSGVFPLFTVFTALHKFVQTCPATKQMLCPQYHNAQRIEYCKTHINYVMTGLMVRQRPHMFLCTSVTTCCWNAQQNGCRRNKSAIRHMKCGLEQWKGLVSNRLLSVFGQVWKWIETFRVTRGKCNCKRQMLFPK